MNNERKKGKLVIVKANKPSGVLCRRCGQAMQRIRRPNFARTFLSWLPFRRYYCYGCMCKRWAKLPELSKEHKPLTGENSV